MDQLLAATKALLCKYAGKIGKIVLGQDGGIEAIGGPCISASLVFCCVLLETPPSHVLCIYASTLRVSGVQVMTLGFDASPYS